MINKTKCSGDVVPSNSSQFDQKKNPTPSNQSNYHKFGTKNWNKIVSYNKKHTPMFVAFTVTQRINHKL